MNSDSSEQKLVDFLKTYDKVALPPLRELASHLSIATRSGRRAVHALTREGILVTRGNTYIVAGRNENRPNDSNSIRKETSAHRVAAALKQRILSGSIQGSQLPKRGEVASLMGVSERTVGQAYRILEHEQLIYRSGRIWRIGSLPDVIIKNKRESSWALLLALPHENSWHVLATDQRTGKFVAAFTQAAEDANVRILPAIVNEDASYKGILTKGLRRAISEIKRIGDDLYKGTLIAGGPVEIVDFAAVMQTFLDKKKPVVWFDRQAFSSAPPVASQWLLHCRFSEQNFSEAALSYLSGMGHRCIGFYGKGIADWEKERFAILRRAAQRYSDTHFITASWDAVTDLSSKSQSDLVAYFTRLADSGSSLQKKTASFVCQTISDSLINSPNCTKDNFSRKFARRLSEWLFPNQDTLDTPLFFIHRLIPLLLQDRLTAIIVANEQLARQTLPQINKIGINMPSNCSFVTYDNYRNAVLMPMDSVDMGSAELGQRALDVIIGNLPADQYLTKHGYGELIAVPHIEQRGSAANPHSCKQ